jgi:hypothetical protein
MKAKTIGIILIILLSSFITDRAVSFLLGKMYEMNRYGQSGGNLNYYLSESKKQAFDFLILGNSRAHHNLNPDSLSGRGFNLSHNGMNISFQIALLNVLASNHALPTKKVILQVEPTDFLYWNDTTKLYADAQHLKYYYYNNELVRKYINAISSTEFLKYYFHSYRFNGQLPSLMKNLLLTFSQPQTGTGFYGRPHHNFQDEIIRKQAEGLKNEGDNALTSNDTCIQALDLLFLAKTICDKHQIELELFTSPYFYSPMLFEQYSMRISNWSNENGVEYYNFIVERSQKLDDLKCWIDNYHLSTKGAAIFSGEYPND